MSENPTIYEPLRQVIIGCGDPDVTSAVAFWVTGSPTNDALGWLHCITSDDDRARIAKTLRDHADLLERMK